ncbi:MAG: hypothetical protein R2742_04180 [Micropruina glycogenica]
MGRQADEVGTSRSNRTACSWGVGERMLGLLRAGHSPDEVQRAEWLRGTVPPGLLGTRLLKGLGAQLEPIMAALPAEAAAPLQHHDIAVDCGPVRVVGRVATQQQLVLQATFAKPSESRRIEAWLRLLALCAADDRDWTAMLVAHGGAALRLQGLDQPTASALLGSLGAALPHRSRTAGAPAAAVRCPCGAAARFRR